MEVTVMEIDPKPYLAIRRRLTIEEMPSVMGGLYGRVYSHLAEAGEKPAGPSLTVVHSWSPTELDLECGVLVEDDVQGKGDIKAGSTPGGRCATAVYVGPYDGLAAAWEEFTAEVKRQGLESKWPSWEEYRVTPQDVEDHAQCETVLYEPVG